MSVCCGWFGRSVCHNFLRIHMFQFLNVLVNCWCTNWMYIVYLILFLTLLSFLHWLFSSLSFLFSPFSFFLCFFSLLLSISSLSLSKVKLSYEWPSRLSVSRSVGWLVGRVVIFSKMTGRFHVNDPHFHAPTGAYGKYRMGDWDVYGRLFFSRFYFENVSLTYCFLRAKLYFRRGTLSVRSYYVLDCHITSLPVCTSVRLFVR